ncbi:MAG TPA: HTH domain-containing protein, partial [Anaeromyxobacteraceae bacterium]|nr:HTH domain-containing protein [Anaeromyxobacteraceae bacterium]
MTFTEAAVEVLRREGKPLHFGKIAEIAIRESLLDHVGKIPEETMGEQLAAHCRLPRLERRLVAVQPATFALIEWGLDEDPAGLDGIVEPPPEGELAYRPRERHPVPSLEAARGAGRGDGRGRRREQREERRGRRFPPPAEVAYEILSGSDQPLPIAEIAALGAERLLMPDAFVRDPGSLAAALREDNRRREGAGKAALFALEGEAVALVAQPEPGERPTPPAPRPPASAAEMRRAGLASLRRRLRECDGPTLEHLAVRVLEGMGLRDLKVAKRGREQVVYTGRRRMGLGEVRHCVRMIRSGADLGRREVVEVRRDLGHYGGQVGVLLGVGDAGRDARGEASAAGQLPVVLLCGEALAEAFTEAGVGVNVVVVPEIDEAVFGAAAETAEREEAARRARREDRERRQVAARTATAPAGLAAVEGAAPAGAVAAEAEHAEPEGPEAGEGEEGDEAEGAE